MGSSGGGYGGSSKGGMLVEGEVGIIVGAEDTLAAEEDMLAVAQEGNQHRRLDTTQPWPVT